MQRSISFSIAIFCVGFALGTAEDDIDCTRPPHSHHQRHAESQCCADVPVPFAKTKDEMHEIVHKCFEEAGIQKPHHGVHHPHPAEGEVPPPPQFNDTVKDCVDECLLKTQDLLSDDGELKAEEIKALVAKSFTGDWATVGGAAVEKCLAGAQSGIDESSNCKSGAHQLMKCFGREIYLNCPSNHWTESEECKEAKERLMKCPNMPAPRPHHKNH